jgi:hypothetical protein
MNTITRICVMLGLLTIAGCASPHPGTVRNGVDSALLTGQWGELDTAATFTFAADGSFRMSDAGLTRTMGSYTVLSPGIVALTFTSVSPDSNPNQIKYYYYTLKNGKRLLTTARIMFDWTRTAQK